MYTFYPFNVQQMHRQYLFLLVLFIWFGTNPKNILIQILLFSSEVSVKINCPHFNMIHPTSKCVLICAHALSFDYIHFSFVQITSIYIWLSNFKWYPDIHRWENWNVKSCKIAWTLNIWHFKRSNLITILKNLHFDVEVHAVNILIANILSRDKSKLR